MTEKNQSYNILCLTETKQHQEEIKMRNDIYNFSKLRSKKQKKGGGLKIIGKKHPQINWTQKRTSHRDIDIIEGMCYGKKMKIVLVYFDSNKQSHGTDYESNRQLEK